MNYFSAVLGIVLAAGFVLTVPVTGQVWQEITPSGNHSLPFNSRYDGLLAVGSELYVLGGPGGKGVMRSTDGGETFTNINTVAGASYTLEDVTDGGGHGLFYANGWVWFSGTSGTVPELHFLHRLEPGTATWQQAGNGFPGVEQIDSFGAISDVAWDETTEKYYMVAQLHPLGGVWTSSDGLEWEQRPGTKGLGAPSSLVAMNGKVFVSKPLGGGPKKSTDGGVTWEQAMSYKDVYPGRLRRHGDYILFQVVGESYVSGDAGDSWVKTTGSGTTIERSLTSDGTLLYGSSKTFTHANIFYSASNGMTWQSLTNDGLPVSSSYQPFDATSFARVGDNLFVVGDFPDPDNNNSPNPKLFRLDVSGVDFGETTAVIVQPKPLSRYVGMAASFSALVVGENLSYQWSKDGVEIPGATSATLDFAAVELSDDGMYTLEAVGDKGTVTTNSVKLEIAPDERIEGKRDFTYDPEETRGGTINGGTLLALHDGTIARVDGKVLGRIDLEGNILAEGSFKSSSSDIRPKMIIQDAAGRLVVLGYVSSDKAQNQRIIRIDPATWEIDPAFDEVLRAVGGVITQIAELPGRGYVVIGDFTALDTPNVPAERLALIRYDGTVDPDFPEDPLPREADSVVVGYDGSIYLFRAGSMVYGETVTAMRLDSNGKRDESFPKIIPTINTNLTFLKTLNDGRMLILGSSRTPRLLTPDGIIDSR